MRQIKVTHANFKFGNQKKYKIQEKHKILLSFQ